MAHNAKSTLGSSLDRFFHHSILLLLSFLLLLLLPSPSHQNPAPLPREKRQTFDFSMNTPRPTETNVSNNDGVPDPPPLPNSGSLGSALGGLFGSSDSEAENTSTSNTDTGVSETGGSETGGSDTEESHTSHTSSELGGGSETTAPNTGETNTDGGGSGWPVGNFPSPPESGGNSSSSGVDGPGLPLGNAPQPSSGGNSSGDGAGLGGDQSGNVEDNSTGSPNGGGGGLDLGSVLGGGGGSWNGGSTGNGCQSLEALACQMHACANRGECQVLNDAHCTPRCHCPSPYDDTQLYDERCRRRPDPVSSPSPTASSNPLNAECSLRCYRGECRFTNADRSSMYCYCEPGYVGHFCDKPCGRNCSNNGTCDVDEARGTEMCVCPDPWVGPYCSQLPPEEDDSWVYWLVGSLAVGLLLVMIAAALVIYCLWKKRLVFAMKVVYYFKSYEDNDGLKYDAFVSYVSRPEDEDFVYKQLRPKLEQEMGFKLCLHQRDFVIGETISNNICDTLEDSRRFILVLTPRYLESEWAEFEYQKALHEMLKLKMRIVPIILEEITSTSTINPTLRAILQSVTYITYPGCQATQQQLDKFWKRVHLSMPKTKKKDASKELETLKSSYVKSLDGGVVENGMASFEPKGMEALKPANGYALSCAVENETLSDTKNSERKDASPTYATISTSSVENGNPPQMDLKLAESLQTTETNFSPADVDNRTFQTGLESSALVGEVPSENTDPTSGVAYNMPKESADDIASSPAEVNHVQVDVPISEDSTENVSGSSVKAKSPAPGEKETDALSSISEDDLVHSDNDVTVPRTLTTVTQSKSTERNDTNETNSKLNAKPITNGNVFTKLFSSKKDEAETVTLQGYRPLEGSSLVQLSESKHRQQSQNGLYTNGAVNEAFDG